MLQPWDTEPGTDLGRPRGPWVIQVSPLRWLLKEESRPLHDAAEQGALVLGPALPGSWLDEPLGQVEKQLDAPYSGTHRARLKAEKSETLGEFEAR